MASHGRLWLLGATLVGAGLLLLRAAAAEGGIGRVYTVADGLAHASVLAMAEDRDGLLWLGTADGVSRFDGTEFLPFPPGGGGPSGPVLALRATADGSMWLATPRGLRVFEHGHFTLPSPASGLHGRWVQAMAGLPDGRLLLALDSRLWAATSANHIESRPLPPAWFARRDVAALLAARDGTIYLGAVRHGAAGLRGDRLRPVPGVPGDTVLALFETGDGTLAWGTNAGFALQRRGEQQATPVSWIHDRVQALAQAEDGTLLLGTGASGVVRLRLAPAPAPPRPAGALTLAEGLPSNTVLSLHTVRGGTLYVGTRRGLAVVEAGPTTGWSAGSRGLPRGEVNALAEARDGTLWAGTSDGLRFLREGEWRRPRRDALGPRAVTALATSAAGTLYAATESGHAATVRGETVRLLGPRRGLASGRAWAIHPAPDGTVYFSLTRGIFALRQGRLRRWLPLRQPAPALASSAGGTLYVGTYSGLAAVAAGRPPQLWAAREGLADGAVLSLLAGGDGTLYAGTARGLSIRRSGRLLHLDHRRGLADDVVQCLVADGTDRLYVGTNRGVDILALRGEGAAPALLQTLTRADGLAGEAISRGACLRDHRGRLWFGSAEGVSVYDPRQPAGGPAPPAVRLVGLERSGEEVALPAPGEVRRFGAGENRLAFSFAALDLRRPFHGPYAYRWLGGDPWSVTVQRSVEVAHLAPGRYRFEVRAGDGAGRWGRAAVLPFEIPAPFWRRPGFLALAAAAFAAVVALGIAVRLRGLLALARLRSRIAANLHDHLGAGLCEISILASLETRRRPPGEGGGELSRVTTLAGELAAELDDLVWLVHPRHDSLEELILRLKDRFAEVAAWSGIEFSARGLTACAGLRLPMAHREGLYALFREAFHNALRHSGCRALELSVRRDGRRIEICLDDDGRGFDPAGGERGEGLANMARRAADLGGRLDLRSAPGAGTRVRFAGPLDPAPRLAGRLLRRLGLAGAGA